MTLSYHEFDEKLTQFLIALNELQKQFEIYIGYANQSIFVSSFDSRNLQWLDRVDDENISSYEFRKIID